MTSGDTMTGIPIFISYAHLDNRAIPPEESGWISGFHQALQVRLSELAGYDVEIWRDDSAVRNGDIWKLIEERLGKGGIVVSVLTPRYVSSESCLRELQAVRSGGPLLVRDRSRIFKVVKTPCAPGSSLPAELRDVLDYPFFAAEGMSLDPGLDRREYLKRLFDLAHDIREMMDLLAAGPPPAAKGTVYLAETSSDLIPQRDEVRRDLQQRGYEVLPARPVPWDTLDFRQSIRADLGRSMLSVHLIGARTGIVPEGEEESIVALQEGLAAGESAGRFFPRLLWLPVSEEPKQKRQQDFIDRLLNDRSAQPGRELLRTPLEELKTVLLDTLTPKPTRPAEGGPSPQSRVYLICHESDLEAVDPIRDYLFERGCEVDLPLFEGDETMRGEYHKALLQMNDAVVVYYGNVGDDWLKFRVLDLRKAPGYRGADSPPLARAVYVGNPVTPQKQQLKMRDPRLLRSDAECLRTALEPFLADLASSGRAA
jgi:hypothetical protein